MKALVSDNKTGSLPTLCACNINDFAASSYYKIVQRRERNNPTKTVLVELNFLWHSIAPSFQAMFSQKLLIKPKVYTT